MMMESMDLRVHLGAFNTLIRDVFNVGEKIEEEYQTCLFMTSLSKSYDFIMMSLLEKKSHSYVSGDYHIFGFRVLEIA
jgi:gag-polypeptide of LTR copia-type